MIATPLYKQLLGASYDVLPEAVQELHNLKGSAKYTGHCNIKRGKNLLSHLTAHILSMPPAGENVSVTVEFVSDEAAEHWTRHFGAHKLYSRQYRKGKFLYEKIGATTLVFSVLSSPEKLSLRLEKLKFLGIPTPRFLHPVIIAEETGQNGEFCFHIEASMPFIGLVISYSGSLKQI